MQRGNIAFIALFVVVFLVFGGVWGYYFYNKQQLSKNADIFVENSQTEVTSDLNQSFDSSASAKGVFTVPSDWKTYTRTSGETRYSFQYPPALEPAEDGRSSFYLKGQPVVGQSLVEVFVLEMNSVKQIEDQYKSLPKRDGVTSEIIPLEINGKKVVKYIEKKECLGDCPKNDWLVGYEMDVVGPKFSLSFVPQMDGEKEVSESEFKNEIETMAGSAVFN